jgi:hypothetical protein
MSYDELPENQKTKSVGLTASSKSVTKFSCPNCHCIVTYKDGEVIVEQPNPQACERTSG